ncbi:CmcJ/NvfI family oxidoreductase [Novosphingobium lentum]|uniref:CmcJ/NvfI family oxidoreductase n=1 Tax=Novosphingobium lentum TaxID=145287 RepID=UPI000836A093|nr:CmcJ/NvfI family oxidoreductase [Novosphingobium lentum]
MGTPITARIAYSGRALARPRYYANAHDRDEVDITPMPMPIGDARAAGCTIDREGFELVHHASAVRDFADRAEVAAIHKLEIEALVQAQTGADLVVVSSPGLLRFSEKSGKAGTLNNSMPARFAHIDVSDQTAAMFAARGTDRKFLRYAQYNVWRALSAPPQDVPLALCDARSLSPADLIVADAVFDEPGKPEWSFESYVVAHNPAHRWLFFPNLTRDEAILFKTKDSDSERAHHVPHVAFDLPDCPADAPPRTSIEMRATAYWWA